jgi:enoyl-[acyl-carrier protein] reductase I
MTELTATESFFADLKRRVEGPEGALAGKKAVVIGIANNQSIAYGCALAFRALGAELAMTYLNDKTKQYTQALADRPLFTSLATCA